jgi:hypothetical protein
MSLTHTYQTFDIDIKLHKPILSSYHAGDYTYQCCIDGVVVDRIIDQGILPGERGHRFSSLLYQSPSGFVMGQAGFSKLVRP